ncbi:hypothetical protein [Pedobacter arcticus]|uniref:hypothetical protein n=1 Tax=Pedobacter arcticus TaxID=752140 RepID=UPI00031D5DAF|nr:hypothetical protein [Pedobacter arcticus]
MKLIFPFKNIATNNLLDLTDNRENIYDFILTQQGKYPYSENYFLAKVEGYRNSLPNFENEILQIINTSNQTTIDAYFIELLQNFNYIKEKVSLDELENSVSNWNEKTLKAFEDNAEKETQDYFSKEDRKRNHLEEYEEWDFGGYLGFIGKKREHTKVKRINYNFYCIDKQPDLVDKKYCKEYQEFLKGLSDEYLEIARRYGIPYSKGEIKSKVEQVVFSKPVVFVEGEHDITFIVKASELLNKQDILAKIELRQRGGYTNLDKIWEIYKDNNWETVPQKKLLLYDCDTKKQDEETGIVYKRIIQTIPQNLISKGIENLFPDSIVKKAIAVKCAYIDITKVHTTKRGVITENTICEVNKDEKKNFCKWICENATADDFKNFHTVFDLINLVV